MAGIFEVYNKQTNQLIIRIEEKVDAKPEIFIHPGFGQLRRIDTADCFRYRIKGDGEPFKTFNASLITHGDQLYPKALEMYCRTQFLTHPETYTTENPQQQPQFKAEDWTERK
jgi:hypothetical protein